MTAKVTFIPEQKIISVNLGVRALDVQYDIYSEWKRWVMVEEYNTRFPVALRTVGGDDLIDGKTLGATFFLMNGWKIKPPEENGNLNVSGNLYDDAGGTVFVNTIGSYNSMIIQTVSNLTDSQLVESTLSQSLDYGGTVYYNENSSYSGTLYPMGTVNYPVNNINDAVELCNIIGTRNIVLHGNVSMSSNFEGYNFRGSNTSSYVFCNGYDFSSCSFENVVITGNITGRIRAMNCLIENSLGLHGEFYTCALAGIIRLGNAESCFMMCFTRNRQDDYVYICGSELHTSSIGIRAYSGCIYFDNFSDINTRVDMDFISGKVVLASNNHNSSFIIRGVVLLENLSDIEIDCSVIINPVQITDTLLRTPVNSYNDSDTLGGFIKNKLLTVAKFVGLK
jgi:hypothetical protein